MELRLVKTLTISDYVKPYLRPNTTRTMITTLEEFFRDMSHWNAFVNLLIMTIVTFVIPILVSIIATIVATQIKPRISVLILLEIAIVWYFLWFWVNAYKSILPLFQIPRITFMLAVIIPFVLLIVHIPQIIIYKKLTKN